MRIFKTRKMINDYDISHLKLEINEKKIEWTKYFKEESSSK